MIKPKDTLAPTLHKREVIWGKGTCSAVSRKSPRKHACRGLRRLPGSPFLVLVCFSNIEFLAHLGLFFLSKPMEFGFRPIAPTQTSPCLQNITFRIFTLVASINPVKKPVYTSGKYRQGLSFVGLGIGERHWILLG